MNFLRRHWKLIFILVVIIAAFQIVFRPIRIHRGPKEAVEARYEVKFPYPIAETPQEKAKAVEEAKEMLAKQELPEPRITMPARDRMLITLKVFDEEEFKGYAEDIVAALGKKWKGAQIIRKRADFPEKPVARLLGGSIEIYKPRPKVTLGLDLAGGVQLVLRCRHKGTIHEFKLEKPIPEDKQVQVRADLERWLRERVKIRGAEVEIPTSDRLIVRTEATRVRQREWEAKTILAHLRRTLGPAQLVRSAAVKLRPETINQVEEVVRLRVDKMGVAEARVQKQGMDRIMVQIPGYTNPERALRLLGKTALLEFRHIPKKYRVEVEIDEFGREVTVFKDKEGKKVPVEQVYRESRRVLTGAHLKPGAAMADIIEVEGPVVHFELDSYGRRVFARFTRRHVGEYLGIFLDGDPICVPRIKEAITGGKGIITGFESLEEAKDLQVLLNAGALPVPLDVVENRTVSAMLGKDAVERSLKAGIIGFCAVALFMTAYYLLPGFVAAVILCIYVLLVLAGLCLVHAALTLPGIAGLILSVGMAVDANVLIFERLKEELRAGKPLRTALELGFNRAWAAIVDSNVTTLIAALVLGLLGTGPIRGFAIILSIGIIVSLFTAVTVTKTILFALAETSLGRNLALYRT